MHDNSCKDVVLHLSSNTSTLPCLDIIIHGCANSVLSAPPGVQTPCYPHPRGCKLRVIRTSGGANSVLSASPGVRTLCYRYQKGVQLRPTNVYFKKPFVFCRMLCFIKNQNRYPDILVLHRLANKQLCLNVGLFVRLHKPTNLKWLSLATTFTSFILNL